jgi:ubiquinol-cytochrome c reductase cytochrome b subunit
MGWLKAPWRWFDERTGLSKFITPIAEHPVPAGTTGGKSGWMYVLGAATLAAFISQVVTGIALAMAYVPSAANAYDSISFISNDFTLGRVLRGAHFFGASAMVICIGLHMARVYLTGSYKYPREVNWLTGTLLLALTIVMAFTGQLLRWDQDGVWSVVIAAEQAGRVPLIGHLLAHFILAGETIGAATLSRFFAFHVFFVPALIFATLGFHLYLVLHNGISEPPKAGRPVDPKQYRRWYEELLRREGRPYWPDGAWHEVLVGGLLIVLVVALAIVFGPPHLGRPPDPSIIQANPRPDWYLLWYFALLALLRPGVEDYFIVLAPLIFFVVLILVPFLAGKGERSPSRRPWAVGVVLASVLLVGGLTIEGERSPWAPNFDAKPITAAQLGTGDPTVARGAALFHDKGCQYCHAIDGQGGIRGPDLSHIADRLTAGDMAAIIARGVGTMPAYANTLTPDEMNALVTFLATRTEKHQQPSTARQR